MSEIRRIFDEDSRALFPAEVWKDLSDGQFEDFVRHAGPDGEHGLANRLFAHGIVSNKWPERAVDDDFVTRIQVALTMSISRELQRRWLESQSAFTEGMSVLDGLAELQLRALDRSASVLLPQLPRQAWAEERQRFEQQLQRKRQEMIPLLHLMAFAEHLADELELVTKWDDLSNEDLVEAIDRIGRDPDYMRDEAVRLVADLFDNTSPRVDAVDLLRHALTQSLLMQLSRRKQAKETPGSKAAMSFLVNADAAAREEGRSSIYAADALQALEDATEKLTAISTEHLTWHPELSDKEQAREEIRSMAQEGLVERLGPILNDPDPLRARLLAAIDGSLKGLPDNVRISVRGRLETIDRHQDIVADERHRILDESNILVERVFDNEEGRLVPEPIAHHQPEDHLLLKEQDATVEIALSELSEEERTIVEMTMDGYSQDEIGERLGKSRSAVAKKLERLKPKVRRPE